MHFDTFSRLFWISRPVLWINSIGPAFIGLWLTGKLWHFEFLPILLWLTLPFNLLIYGINDISDREVDALSTRKGGLEGVKLQKSEVWQVLLAVTALNLPFLIYFAAAFSSSAFFVMIAYALIFLAYSVEPIRLKARPIVDSLSNAAYALPLWFVPLAFDSSVNYQAVLALMAWCMAKHTYDSVQDIHDDAAMGLRTTAVVYGLQGALLWSTVWWLISVAVMWQISAAVATVILLGALLLVGGLAFHPNPERAHKLYKYSIGYPYIAGGFAGIGLAWSVFVS